MKAKNIGTLALAIIIAQAAGIIGSLFTMSEIAGWYSGLIKPEFNPPAWVFGPVWTTLYALMGVAAWLVWRQRERGVDVRKALAVFGVQLVLNALWSIIFFNLHSIEGALIEIVLLWLAIVYTMILFYRISKPAMWLLVPYILWVSFASYLTYALWRLN